MLKKQNGITLIALIITVIVMLILVGVTINVALNGGLFQKAETATRATEEKAILEEMLAMMEIDDNGKFKHETIISNMRTKHPEYTIAYSYPNATITGKLGTYNYIVSETEIKIGGNGASAFSWSDVGLDNVDTSTAYKGYIEPLKMTVIVSFTENGKVIMETNGAITEINAKDPDNIDEATGNLSFLLEIVSGTSSNIVVTMNDNDPNVYANIEGLGTITYEKQGKTIYSNEEVLKMVGESNSTGTYTGTWTVLESDGEGNPTKLVSTSNVTRYTLGYEDPKATGADNFAKSIWSYKNAVNSLNTAAQEATGIASAESISIQDIYDIIGEENVNKGTSYGTQYNYYYNTEDSKVYSKYETGTDENGEIIWSTGISTGHSSQTFIDDNGNTVVVDSEKDNVTLTYTDYYYDLTDDQKAQIGTLASGYYWLTSHCVSCTSYYEFFLVRCVYDGSIDSDDLFDSGGGAYYSSYGVRAVVSI